MIRPSLAEVVRFRAAVETAIHRFFSERDVIGISVPSIVPSPGMEPHLRAFPIRATEARELDGGFLHTSPEYAIKSCLAELDADIYCMCRCFRDEPPGPMHHPEFTMLEWYRCDRDYGALMEDCEELLRACARAVAGDGCFARGDQRLDLGATFRRVRWVDAFRESVGLDPLVASTEALREASERFGLGTGAGWDRAALVSLLQYERVEPSLAGERPVCLIEFPADQAALARLCPADSRVAERFELYVASAPGAVGGRRVIELANAFTELVDAGEQRDRFASETTERQALGRPVYPMPERMLAGIARLGLTAGIALGVERLLVLLAGWAHAWDVEVADFLAGEALARPFGAKAATGSSTGRARG